MDSIACKWENSVQRPAVHWEKRRTLKMENQNKKMARPFFFSQAILQKIVAKEIAADKFLAKVPSQSNVQIYHLSH